MRPVRLRMRGFGAFRDETDVDFADTDVFALVGATGSGKSTVIDAVCFALYGSVPRHGERLVEPVVSVGANEAAVELTFESGDDRYLVVRVVRRTGRDGKVTTKEARLERLHDDGHTEVVAGAARELLPAVESLLGLGFGHFTRCVVLPQGEFARFLHDKPADRQELLERLLGLDIYDVLLKQTNQRAAEARVSAELAARQQAALPAADDETLAAAAARAGALGALLDDMAAAGDELDGLQQAATEARERAEAGQRLAEALGTVSVPSAVAELGDLLADARRELTVADAARTEAAARLTGATSALAAFPALDVLEAAARAHERIGRGREVRADRERELDGARGTHAAATVAESEAATAEAEARDVLDDARRAHAAHDLAAHLVAGELCPVCEQQVAALPKRRRPAALAAAERHAATATAARQRAAATLATALDAVNQASAEVAKVDAILATLADQIAAHPDAGALAATLDAVHAAAATAEAARTDDDQAAKDLAAAGDVLARFETAMTQAAVAFHAQRDAVAAAAPPPPGPDLVESWRELASFAAAERKRVAQRSAVDTKAAVAARTAHDAALGRLLERTGTLDVTAAPRLDALTTAVVRAHEQAEVAVRQLEAARIDRARLGADIAAAEARYAVAHELGRHLSSSGFPRWLVTEALDLLVADASALLLRLSDGKYSLVAVDDGRDLGVVDHANADEVRPVRSLSGGETFQASLAFALALSDHLASLAAGGGARLDAIFLDEGFGTLDADSLDTVAATIEALAGGGRMVGIVTHVRELAERVPVRYVVTKGVRTAAVSRVVA
jgi:exonuclease SbcC